MWLHAPDLSPPLPLPLSQAFVRFTDAASASAAREAVHGRMFAGTAVSICFITEATFVAVGV